MLKQLVDQGYVVQKEGAQDRRQRLLYVTPKGEALALKLAGLQTERINRAFAELGPERARGGAALSDRHDRRRQSRRRAAPDRARRARQDARPDVASEDLMLLPATLSDDAPHLLVVDDDRRIRDLLSRFLSGEGYRVTTAETAADARAKLNGLSFDLLILDVMMPGESGFDFAKSLRGTSSVPILMLTARDAAESRIKGLEMGADDYLSKPFEPRELSLRIANILKRAQPAAAPPVESVRFGPFVYHLARGELRKGEEVIRLTDREREMLRILTATPGETVSRLALAGNGGTVSRARGRRAGQPAAPQDRAQSRPIRCSCRPCAASATGWWPAHDQPRHRHRAIRSVRRAAARGLANGTTRSRRSATSTPCSAASATAGGASAAGSTA